MSIVVNIYYIGVNGNARKFAEEMEHSGIADSILQECGNERYEYFLPMSDPETVLLLDIWKDQDALDTHHASSMMEKIAHLREIYDLHMKVERYVVDEGGIPTSDTKFIKV